MYLVPVLIINQYKQQVFVSRNLTIALFFITPPPGKHRLFTETWHIYEVNTTILTISEIIHENRIFPLILKKKTIDLDYILHL